MGFVRPFRARQCAGEQALANMRNFGIVGEEAGGGHDRAFEKARSCRAGQAG
jgi:hypothetical protein